MTTEAPPQQSVTLTIEQALNKAIAHHQAGELQDAEKLYRAILQAQPNHPDANHNLGTHPANPANLTYRSSRVDNHSRALPN